MAISNIIIEMAKQKRETKINKKMEKNKSKHFFFRKKYCNKTKNTKYLPKLYFNNSSESNWKLNIVGAGLKFCSCLKCSPILHWTSHRYTFCALILIISSIWLMFTARFFHSISIAFIFFFFGCEFCTTSFVHRYIHMYPYNIGMARFDVHWNANVCVWRMLHHTYTIDSCTCCFWLGCILHFNFVQQSIVIQ